MLVLQVKSGEEVILYDQEGGRELGKIKFMISLYPDPHRISLGFDLLQSIKVLRATLVKGKDTNGKEKTQ